MTINLIGLCDLPPKGFADSGQLTHLLPLTQYPMEKDMTQREAFEAWAKSQSLDTDHKEKDAWGREQYSPHIHSMWQGWQAARVQDQREIEVLKADVERLDTLWSEWNLEANVLIEDNKKLQSAIEAAQAQTTDCGCIGPRDCTGECCEKAAVEPVKDVHIVDTPVEANNDEVICPNCCNQFRAIPVNVQQLMLDAGFEPPFKTSPAVEPMTEVADRFAHRMALELECVLSEGAYSHRWYTSAMQVLSEYRSAMNAIHEQHSPTFMGEPALRGVSDAQERGSVPVSAHTTGESSGHPTMQDAIDAGDGCLHSTIDALQTRVVELEAQAAVEPVAWMNSGEVTLDRKQFGHLDVIPLYTSPPDHTKVMRPALEALNNSVDLVWEEYTEAERNYGDYPTRRAKLDGMKAMAQQHTDAIAALEGALK